MTADTTQPRRISKQSKVALAVAGIAGVGLAVWLTVAPNKIVEPETATNGTAPLSNDPREAVRAEVPAELALSPDTVAPGTRSLAPTLPNDAGDVAKAIAQAQKDGVLPARAIPGAAPGCPRMAGELGDAMLKKTPMFASSFELATLLGGVLKTRGGVVEYGVVPKAKFAATELLARRFVVRVPNGAWLAADGGTVDGAVALSDLDFLGYVLGYRALGAIAKKDGDTASRAAGLARRLLPDDPAIGFVEGAVEASNGLVDESRRTFEAAAAKDSDAMTWYRMGRQARTEQRPFKADEYFKKAIATDATFAAPHVELAELALERLDVTPQEERPALVEAAKKAVADADAADPKAVGIRIVKAHLFSMDGKNDDARAALEEEVKLHPEDPMSFVMLANVYAAEQKDDDALKVLEDARGRGHETGDVLEGLGALYAMKSRFDDAKKAYERALELDPENKQYRLQLAQLERQGGNVQKTRELLQQQIAKFPDDPMGGLLLAQLELSDSHPEMAKVQVDKILAKDPNSKEGRILDYVIGVVTNKPDAEARAKAWGALGTRRKLAEMLLQNGLLEEAEVVLKEALGTETADMTVPVLLTALYTATGRVDDATKLQDETMAKVDPAQKEELKKLFAEAIAQALKSKDGAPPEAPPLNP